MTLETGAQLVGIAVGVITLLVTLHDKHPRLFRNILESIFAGIPFGLLLSHLPIAIVLFTVKQLYDLYKEAKKPSVSIIDVYWSLAALCLNTCLFATTAVLVRQ